jgi:hypothetical protein
MSPTELGEHLFQEPFVPLRVTLAGGDQVVIDNRNRAVISGLTLFYSFADDPSSRIGNRGKLMSIPNIVMVEPLHPRDPRNRGRHR